MDDVVPFRAGHSENKRVGEEHPSTDGAAVIKVGLEEVAELVGVEEPVEGAVGARVCGGQDRGWTCPRRGRGGERVGAVLRADGRGLGRAVVGGTGPSGRVRCFVFVGGERGSSSETSAAAAGGGGGPGAASGGAAATKPGGHRERGISAPVLMSSMRHKWNFAW